eukprot:20262-Heterococcus_DN1.PRE.2
MTLHFAPATRARVPHVMKRVVEGMLNRASVQQYDDVAVSNMNYPCCGPITHSAVILCVRLHSSSAINSSDKYST